MNITEVRNTIKNSMTYVLWAENIDYCVLIDCGEYETLAPVLQKLRKRVHTVLLTHGHSDHIYGLVSLLEQDNSITIGTNEYGHIEIQDIRKNLSLYNGNPFAVKEYQPFTLKDGQQLHFDGLADIEVIATPGHDISCLTYRIGNNLFTGDSYIPGIKVFSKFPSGNKEQALANQERLKTMEDNGYIIHCGHHSYEDMYTHTKNNKLDNRL